MAAGNHLLRIGCYGYAELAAGSVSSAGNVVLKGLLRRGHQIDFFGKRSFAYPEGLESFPNFRYIEVEGKLERAFDRGSRRGPRLCRAILSSLTARETTRNIPLAIAAEHFAGREYDVQLFLGTWAFGRVAGLPSVSWVQGPPGTDGRSIRRHRGLIRRLDGTGRYALLRAYALYRETIGQPPYDNTDWFICGSRWSAEFLQPCLPGRAQVRTLPYPIDLEIFCPDASSASPTVPEILWLGRSVPRKRLDLFLAACEQLIDAGRNVTVRVVGGFGFTPGYRRLLNEFRYPDRLQACDGVPRQDVPALLRRASVLVQPSEEENFGSSVAEALACGTPVVLGPTNGTGDYIADAGVRFERYETSSVADAIGAALDQMSANPDACRARCRAVAESAFDADPIVERLVQFLHEASGLEPLAAAMAKPSETHA